MDIAKEKGFGTRPEEINTMEKLALIHSEVSEALDAFRKKRMDGENGFEEELADIVIRVAHLAGIYGIDIEKEILKKLNKAKAREWKWEELNEMHS